MTKLLFFILLFVTLLQCYSKRYSYLTYNDIVDKMKELSFRYSRYCKLMDIKLEYDHLVETSCGKAQCEYWYLQITDFSATSDQINVLPQVLFVGGIHGDETLSSNILINLAEYLLQKNEEEEEITNLIKSRFLIIFPISNPSGFYLNRREERQSSGIYVDPNRDFPYNIQDGKCLMSSTARAISHLFKKYMVQAAISFHGGGQSISYPWGSSKHFRTLDQSIDKSEECPDERAFADTARILSKEAGNNTFLSIDSYPFGRISDTIHPINGSLEDWAYAASWEPNIISKCEQSSLLPTETEHNSQSTRALIFLVDTSQTKSPTSVYLGATEGLEGSKDKYAYGYIPINIKLSLALIDLVEPYIKLKTLYFSEEQKTITIEWQGGGCNYVDNTYLKWENRDSGLVFVSNLQPHKGAGFYQNREFFFKEVIHLNNSNFNMNFNIALTCDQNWSVKLDSKSDYLPQTHFVQARTNQSYYAEYNSYKITGKKIVELNIKDINLNSLMKTRIKNVKDLILLMEFSECSGYNNIGTITAQIIEKEQSLALQFLGKLNTEDPFLEGHLYKFGDISRCQLSIGSMLNSLNMENTVDEESSLLFKMEKDEIKTVKIDYKMNLFGEHNILNFIGRSILLERHGHPDQTYIAQILPLQPSSCKKANDMKNCLGVNLGSNQGVCNIKVAFEDGIHDIKLFINSESDGKSIQISGLVPNEVIDHYYRFDEIYIINEKIEKKFVVKKDSVHGYGVVEQKSFNLYPDIALGNLLKVYIQAFGDKVSLGECSIVLKDPDFDETKNIIENYNAQMHEKAKLIRKNMLYFLLICAILALAGVALSFLVRRYKNVKQQTFEVAMSSRRERYADTARMIGSARSDRPLGSVRGMSSARLALNLGQKDPVRSDRPIDFKLSSKNPRRHMELEEQDFDDEDN